ncbi:MAG TPA: SDR family NAD(P)-dependent oxidoreductase, partial [Candidatus Limnocylindria bacterium]|nr:SDR family NAD(P)-dependent oxidoreductase [Candidatus Limnocylindria bacterium]
MTGDEVVNPTHAALVGFFGSMTKEQPGWKTRCLDLAPGEPWPEQTSSMPVADRAGTSWAWRNRQWFRERLVPALFAPEWRTPLDDGPLRKGGTYVIIGGAGGVGTVWTEYLIRQYQARVIWIGRRAKTPEIQRQLDALAAYGPGPEYLSADAANLASLQGAYREIKIRYGSIHGVVHSAIVLSDQSVRHMTEEQFAASFSAKAAVSVRLAQVFGGEPLDFVLFFSSMMSQVRPAGQSNYVSGSLFNDVFARRLSREKSCRVKVMNWGYWGGAGVVASGVYQDRMARAGLGSIEPSEAMDALQELLSSPVDQMALIRIQELKAAEQMGLGQEWIEVLSQTGTANVAAMRSRLPDFGPRTAEVRAAQNECRNRALDDWFARLLWAQIMHLGNLPAGQAPKTTVQLAGLLGLEAGYTRWLDETLNACSARGFCRREGNGWVVPQGQSVEPGAVWAAWEDARGFWFHNTNTQAQVVLAETALRALPAVLTGKRPATDVLFPGSSMRLVEGIYKNNLASDFFNEALAEVAMASIKQRLEQDPAARIRILEIGAGTGGTTATVLRKLKPLRAHIEEYRYTDLSSAFARHAQSTFGAENPFLVYQNFDVTRPLGLQGMPIGAFDLVIATNVLHATPNIRTALRNAKSALRANGLLLVNEFVENTVFTHVTFGLLAGWWLYEDAAVRLSGSPGLTADSWLAVLRDEGYRNGFLPLGAGRDLGQQVIVAQSNGVIRQERALPAQKPKNAPQEIPRKVPPVRPPARVITQTSPDDVGTEDFVRDTLVAKLGESLKIQMDQIDYEIPFAEFGVDSITGVRFVEALNTALGIELSTTALFDHSTVNRLTTHIVARYGEGLRESALAKVPTETPVVPERPKTAAPTVEAETKSPAAANSPRSTQQCPIAIIGISGRFAQSRTPEELWQHLAKGDDLVGEASRWDLGAILSQALGNGQGRCRWGSFLDGIDEFDPLFF